MNFDKISILINDEPEIEATIRPIKSGTETEISIAINNSCGLGIGCIGGCETALVSVQMLYCIHTHFLHTMNKK